MPPTFLCVSTQRGDFGNGVWGWGSGLAALPLSGWSGRAPFTRVSNVRAPRVQRSRTACPTVGCRVSDGWVPCVGRSRALCSTFGCSSSCVQRLLGVQGVVNPAGSWQLTFQSACGARPGAFLRCLFLPSFCLSPLRRYLMRKSPGSPLLRGPFAFVVPPPSGAAAQREGQCPVCPSLPAFLLTSSCALAVCIFRRPLPSVVFVGSGVVLASPLVGVGCVFRQGGNGGFGVASGWVSGVAGLLKGRPCVFFGVGLLLRLLWPGLC